MNLIRKIAAGLLCVAVVCSLLPPVAYADTNGNEIKIASEPDRLILQLGPEWAGVEFELKTDSGVFPVPVVVDSNGLLKMDLGGSRTYTLSCLASVAVPSAPAIPEQITETPVVMPTLQIDADKPEPPKAAIPVAPLVIFLLGLSVAAGGLFAMRCFKQRREAYSYDEDEDEDE
jgi:hypothetical protein